jgi:hypothetical protein
MGTENDDKQSSDEPSSGLTIVGARARGDSSLSREMPAGIQVLLSKASVDMKFRKVLLRERGRAADLIGLELNDVEKAMLASIPEDQLAAMIRKTRVPNVLRKTFMGCAAAAMLAAIGVVALRYMGTRVSKQFSGIAGIITR